MIVPLTEPGRVACAWSSAVAETARGSPSYSSVASSAPPSCAALAVFARGEAHERSRAEPAELVAQQLAVGAARHGRRRADVEPVDRQRIVHLSSPIHAILRSNSSQGMLARF